MSVFLPDREREQLRHLRRRTGHIGTNSIAILMPSVVPDLAASCNTSLSDCDSSSAGLTGPISISR